MNYIKHLKGAFQQFEGNGQMNPTHISLYMALFQLWNRSRFPEIFYIDREDIMRSAKIGSKSTYHRCLKDLDTWEYIQYMPSHNPYKGSQVGMPDFSTSTGTTSGTSSGQVVGQALVPNINIDKPIKTKFKLARASHPKNEEEVLIFFKGNDWDATEAQKFYNHYQGIGWKVGGRAAIEDWKATAKKWMLRAKDLEGENNFMVPIRRRNVDHLKIITNKNYGEPL
ncbi:MAG TPA: hypothetical protein VLZ54_01615 [Arenibacter sp.]|nr:hypothetical protein [Arenibacter sp.]